MLSQEYDAPVSGGSLNCLPLAMAYVPMQRLGSIYSPEQALRKGTLFPELDKPFCGRTISGGDGYAV